MKPTLLVAALSVWIVACAPPYLAELDSSASLTRQMTTVGTLGPYNVNGDSTATNVRFLPTKPTAASLGALSVQSGFFISELSGYDFLQFAYLDASGNPQSTSSQNFSLAGPGSPYPFYQYEVTTTTTTANILVFKFDPSTPANSASVPRVVKLG